MSSPPPEKRRRRPLLVPMLLVFLVVAVAGWAREINRSAEYADALVAKTEWKPGLRITTENIDDLVTTRRFPKSVLFPEHVTLAQDLLGKQITRPVHEGERIRNYDANDGRVETPTCVIDLFDPQFYVYTVEFPWAAGVVDGSRVDVLAFISFENRARAVTLLTDVPIIAVKPPSPQTGTPNTIMVSLGVYEEELKLIHLARAQGAKFELLWRHPDAARRHPTQELRETARKQMMTFLSPLPSCDGFPLPVAPAPRRVSTP